MDMIPLFKPYMSEDCINSLSEIFEKGALTEGEFSDKFEKSFSEYIGNENAVLTNSGTSALHLSAILCGLKEGDEVITTSMTCMATNEPFHNMGIKLKFADVDIDTGNICPKSVKNNVTDKTKAIIVVHWAGQPVDLDAIQKIAEEFNLKVIEDAAHALGSEYHGAKIGNHSDFVCFSFQAIKHLTCGDGGALLCKSEKDASRARKIRWFGLDRKYKGKSRWDQDIEESGYKYHMNNINASIGLNNLKDINFIISSHINNSCYYDSNINNNKIKKMKKPKKTLSSSWIYSILVEDREGFVSYMKSKNIAADRVHVRNDQYSVFGGKDKNLKNLEIFDNQLVNIPVGWWLTSDNIEYIVKTINSY